MKLNDFTIWEGLFGIDGEFYLSDSTSNFYDTVIAAHGHDGLRKRWETDIESYITGNSKNNFVRASKKSASSDAFCASV